MKPNVKKNMLKCFGISLKRLHTQFTENVRIICDKKWKEEEKTSIQKRIVEEKNRQKTPVFRKKV